MYMNIEGPERLMKYNYQVIPRLNNFIKRWFFSIIIQYFKGMNIFPSLNTIKCIGRFQNLIQYGAVSMDIYEMFIDGLFSDPFSFIPFNLLTIIAMFV